MSLEEDYPAIENYGVIGDLITVALVGPKASIDSLCWPEFDSPSIFAAHVDRKKGGMFRLCPQLDDAKEKKLYFPGTNILLSRFLSKEGIAEVSDFMYIDPAGKHQAVVRRAKAVHGTIRFRMQCSPRFDYARSIPKIEACENGIIFSQDKKSGLHLRLSSNQKIQIDGADTIAEFSLSAGETATFVLDEIKDRSRPLATVDFSSEAFKETADYWRSWISKCSYRGRWQETVHRSALALKLLTSRRHGSIVAAPSFGFPNDPGGERNWDYRYTWIRDASFTTYAFMRLGFTEEAEAFMDWLEKRIAVLEHGSHLKVMYKIDGSDVDGELFLDHLCGYRNSKPIRVGSTNNDQLQLDIYGELMDSLYMYDKFGAPLSHDLWFQVHKLVDFVAENWRQPDTGIWEIRDGQREFLYSRVMCWVALDRGIRLSFKRSRPAPIEKWIKERDAAYQSVFEEMWSEKKQAFIQFKGTEAMDAGALIMPLVHFISPRDPKWISTLNRIREELTEDSLVYRYRINEAFDEHLEGTDGTFSICSFWYIECLSRSGKLERARYLFEKMLSYASPLGLFSEQIGSHGEALGNVPQAFTHLALISSAFDLNRRLDEEKPSVGGGVG